MTIFAQGGYRPPALPSIGGNVPVSPAAPATGRLRAGSYRRGFMPSVG